MREFAMAVVALTFPAWAWGSAACVPEPNFVAFVERFATDKSFRLERISFPLVVTLGDGAAREKVQERWSRSQFEAISAPLLLSGAALKRHGLSQRIRQVDTTDREVYQFREEADSWRRIFRFRDVDGCWYLIAYADKSL